MMEKYNEQAKIALQGAADNKVYQRSQRMPHNPQRVQFLDYEIYVQL